MAPLPPIAAPAAPPATDTARARPTTADADGESFERTLATATRAARPANGPAPARPTPTANRLRGEATRPSAHGDHHEPAAATDSDDASTTTPAPLPTPDGSVAAWLTVALGADPRPALTAATAPAEAPPIGAVGSVGPVGVTSLTAAATAPTAGVAGPVVASPVVEPAPGGTTTPVEPLPFNPGPPIDAAQPAAPVPATVAASAPISTLAPAPTVPATPAEASATITVAAQPAPVPAPAAPNAAASALPVGGEVTPPAVAPAPAQTLPTPAVAAQTTLPAGSPPPPRPTGASAPMPAPNQSSSAAPVARPPLGLGQPTGSLAGEIEAALSGRSLPTGAGLTWRGGTQTVATPATAPTGPGDPLAALGVRTISIEPGTPVTAAPAPLPAAATGASLPTAPLTDATATLLPAGSVPVAAPPAPADPAATAPTLPTGPTSVAAPLAETVLAAPAVVAEAGHDVPVSRAAATEATPAQPTTAAPAAGLGVAASGNPAGAGQPGTGEASDERGRGDAAAAPVRLSSRRADTMTARFDETQSANGVPTGTLATVSAGGVAETQLARGATGSPAGTPVEQISRGVLLAAQRPGQSVRIELQPEGLGAVALRVSLTEGGVRVHIAVDNPLTRDLLQQSAPQLSQALDQRSLHVDSVFVELAGGQLGWHGAGAGLGGQSAFAQSQPPPQARPTMSYRPAPAAEASALNDPIPSATGRVDYRV